MEPQDYVLKVPLQKMALRKIATLLCNKFHSDPTNSQYFSNKQYHTIVRKLQEKAYMLSLPNSIKEELFRVIVSVYMEVKRWKDYHFKVIPSRNDLVNQICWKSQGTVDYSKTAEKLIRLGQKDTLICYKLSCLNCFEEDIRKFRRQLPVSYYASRGSRKTKVISFWTHFLKEETDMFTVKFEGKPSRTSFQHAFESAALSGNRVATEYFLNKLSLDEKNAYLVKTAQGVVEKRFPIHDNPSDKLPVEKLCDVVIFLLSQMSKEEQIQVFQNHALPTLLCLLDWPWHDLFMKVANYVWPFLTFDEYRCILTILSDNCTGRISNSHHSFHSSNAVNCWKLYGEFYLKSPNHFRIGLLANLANDQKWVMPFSTKCMHWFENLFWTDNTACIKLVLVNISQAEKEILILSKFGVDLCRRLVNWEKWVSLKILVSECNLSNEAKQILKERFIECFFSACLEFINEKLTFNPKRGEWKHFLQMVESPDIYI